MYDHETGSLWSQIAGEAVAGPLAGARLVQLPAHHISWQSWHRDYPQTAVVSKEASPYGHYREDHMMDYYYTKRPGLRPPSHRDQRIEAKAIVLGLRIEGQAKAYPYDTLRVLKTIHDELAGVPIVIFYDEDSDSGRAFLNFDGKPAPVFSYRNGQYEDSKTLSQWSGRTGNAFSGPFAGKKLQPLPYTNCFWFAWRDHYPQTTIYQPAEVH